MGLVSQRRRLFRPAASCRRQESIGACSARLFEQPCSFSGPIVPRRFYTATGYLHKIALQRPVMVHGRCVCLCGARQQPSLQSAGVRPRLQRRMPQHRPCSSHLYHYFCTCPCPLDKCARLGRLHRHRRHRRHLALSWGVRAGLLSCSCRTGRNRGMAHSRYTRIPRLTYAPHVSTARQAALTACPPPHPPWSGTAAMWRAMRWA